MGESRVTRRRAGSSSSAPPIRFRQSPKSSNTAFARWDLSPLHKFELAGEWLVGFPDDTFEPDVVWLDHARLKVCRKVKPSAGFAYVFDLGDSWCHRCTVTKEKTDPLEVYGVVPDRPVAISGCGSIPDQYGRREFDDDDGDDEPE